MIERVWHGWTAPEDADEYERLLREELMPRFAEETTDEYLGIRLLRRSHGDEVEFVTSMRFASLDAVEGFAGEASEEAHVPPAARELLSRYDDRVTHYELRERREYD